MNMTIQRGAWAEQLAEEYLQQQGLQLCARNFRCKLGEIDLIMKENTTLVFIEVRQRSRSDFGSPLETVNRNKQRKLIQTAKYYLQQQQLFETLNCRFDVLSIESTSTTPLENSGTTQIIWIHDAFSAY